MPFKVSFFWDQQTSLLGGWSENFWNTLASIAEVKPKADALRVAMSDYKGNPTYCPRYRISDTVVFRNAETFTTGSLPIAPFPANDADYPTTKVQLVLGASNGRKTSQWFGGVRDTDVSSSGNWNPEPLSNTRLAAIANILATGANGWAIRVLDPAVLPVTIISINGTTGVVTTAANTIPDQARVRIKGVQGMTVANGIWRVQKLSDTTFQLNGWIPTSQLFGKGNPTIRNQVYTFLTIATVKMPRSTSHRVGKPGGLLGGRRKRRKT
jgi:hypothetical protein